MYGVLLGEKVKVVEFPKITDSGIVHCGFLFVVVAGGGVLFRKTTIFQGCRDRFMGIF